MDARSLADALVDLRERTDSTYALWAGELTHLERWDDLSPAGRSARDTALLDLATRADGLVPADEADRRLAETIAFTGRSLVAETRWREELAWVNPADGLVSLLLTFLPRFPLITAEHGERYLGKIAALPAFLDGWRACIEVGAAEGRMPIRHLVSALVDQLDGHLERPLASGPLGRQAPPVEGDAPDAWRDRLHVLLDGPVRDAVRRLRETLVEAALPAARPDDRPGLVHLDGGGEHYERLVWAHTTLDRTAAEVHAIGLAQVERLEAEYRAVVGPLLGLDDVGAIYRALRDDPELHYRDAGTLIADAEHALARAAAAMGDWFGRLPQAPCVATAIEQGALAFYSRPALDGSKPGTFFFNTTDPTMWGTFQLQAVTFHEGIPGHHLQIALALEDDAMHPLLSHYYIAAYNEGWGLYTERLADEMGLYSTALDRVGMLSADSMRACRLVVDTGLHALGWSRDRAIAFMLDHAPMRRTQVEAEIDRYIGSPGQALGYMMGRLEIDALRADAERRLGARFDIRRFHDLVLGTGAVPLSVVRRTVTGWDGGPA